jgi:GrpB-like predicted nucleotidyltransferase (UPF0157 family)
MILEVVMGKTLSEMSLEELWELFPIILKEHNPAYKEWYKEEKDEIIKALGWYAIRRINHIGSSSVTGLISKPTVDILLEVDLTCDIGQLKQKLTKAGWILMSFTDNPELKMAFNKGYTPEGFAERIFHLHLRYLGDWDELYFRDYLMAHKEVADKYGTLKQGLKERYEHDRDGYTEAKTDFITEHTKKAREEFGPRYAAC